MTAPEAPPPADAVDGAGEAPDLESRLREAEQRAAEHHDAWLRARAEVDNARKRAQADVAAAHKYAIEGFATELLPVFDALEAALASAQAEAAAMRDGVELTHRQLRAAFEKAGLVEIDPAGQRFDPHLHQAMTALESTDIAPQTVLQVFQKGFRLHDRVVRPALVAVAKAPATPPPPAPDAAVEGA